MSIAHMKDGHCVALTFPSYFQPFFQTFAAGHIGITSYSSSKCGCCDQKAQELWQHDQLGRSGEACPFGKIVCAKMAGHLTWTNKNHHTPRNLHTNSTLFSLVHNLKIKTCKLCNPYLAVKTGKKIAKTATVTKDFISNSIMTYPFPFFHSQENLISLLEYHNHTNTTTSSISLYTVVYFFLKWVPSLQANVETLGPWNIPGSLHLEQALVESLAGLPRLPTPSRKKYDEKDYFVKCSETHLKSSKKETDL